MTCTGVVTNSLSNALDKFMNIVPIQTNFEDQNYGVRNGQILLWDRTDGAERFTNFGMERTQELIPILMDLTPVRAWQCKQWSDPVS